MLTIIYCEIRSLNCNIFSNTSTLLTIVCCEIHLRIVDNYLSWDLLTKLRHFFNTSIPSSIICRESHSLNCDTFYEIVILFQHINTVDNYLPWDSLIKLWCSCKHINTVDNYLSWDSFIILWRFVNTSTVFSMTTTASCTLLWNLDVATGTGQ